MLSEQLASARKLKKDADGNFLFGMGNRNDNDNDYTGNNEIWTISDELRLIKLDKLHSRVLEYHNNVHQKDNVSDLY